MAAGYNYDKSCNHDCYCQYRVPGGTSILCQFSGYCDFRAPRDSRSIQFMSKEQYCECGPYTRYLTSGKTCSHCGLPVKD
jgi:hypothetical protein